MRAHTPDGGQAFPTLETETYHPQDGMTLRDYFAGQALIGILAACMSDDGVERAARAYRQADFMLIERAKASA